ncbi:hypothetical protein KKG61_02310 [bacterium]|nr:hypothetical protein [bacterium]
MKKDPIVEEIHRIREKILDECGGDIEKFMDHLKACESKDKDRIISWDVQRKRMTTSKHLTSRCLIAKDCGLWRV